MNWNRWPDEKPERSGFYLVWFSSGSCIVSEYFPKTRSFAFCNLTHWAEIEPPEGV